MGVSAFFAAKIGGTNIGLYGDLSVTELDSQVNMAVSGKGCTIIAKSGQYVNVTPFSADLPVLERVEIDDVAIAYDDPISLVTYLLVKCFVDFINVSQFAFTVSDQGGISLP